MSRTGYIRAENYPREKIYKARVEITTLTELWHFVAHRRLGLVEVDGNKMTNYGQRFSTLQWQLQTPIVCEAEIAFLRDTKAHRSVTTSQERKRHLGENARRKAIE